MIESKTGDILAEDAEALVNTVNCVGIMGRGRQPVVRAVDCQAEEDGL